MKKVLLAVLLAGALASCAPGVGSSPAAVVPPPKINEDKASDVGVMTATLNGEPVELQLANNVWTIDTADFILGVTLSPDSFKWVNAKEYADYSAKADYLDFTIFLFDVADANPTGFALSVQNKSAMPINIIWDESAFILPDGSSSRIIHQGVKYSEMNNSQPPTVIPPTARIDEYAAPTNNIFFGSNDWLTTPLFGSEDAGKTASLFLVFNTNETKHNLSISYTPNGPLEIERN